MSIRIYLFSHASLCRDNSEIFNESELNRGELKLTVFFYYYFFGFLVSFFVFVFLFVSSSV